jgi:hypothetical protein
MLLEGQKQIDDWDNAMKKLEKRGQTAKISFPDGEKLSIDFSDDVLRRIGEGDEVVRELVSRIIGDAFKHLEEKISEIPERSGEPEGPSE